MSWIKYIVAGFVILFIQILICEFVNIWPPLYIAIIPLFIILLPLDIGALSLILLGFAIGILTDILSDGIVGLNASACCAVAFAKDSIIKRLIKYDEQSFANNIGSRQNKKSKFITLLLLSYSIFFIFYVLLDGVTSTNFWFVLIRIAINVVVNVVIAYALESLWIRKLF